VSLPTIIEKINPKLRGWFEYFKHCRGAHMSNLDSWLRARLRNILRKRQGKRGRSWGPDHHRWPNEYFRKLGLFSLARAHELQCQTMKMAH
jgi:RNA-directed DNA polymerase